MQGQPEGEGKEIKFVKLIKYNFLLKKKKKQKEKHIQCIKERKHEPRGEKSS